MLLGRSALSTGSTSDALTLAVVALLANGVLQQLIQPVMGATLSLNPLVVLVVAIEVAELDAQGEAELEQQGAG